MLTRIAGAVADGEAVDWDSAERVLPESHRVIARALRTIAESAGGSSRGTSTSGHTPQALRAVPWLWPILGLGTGHVVLGLAGFLTDEDYHLRGAVRMTPDGRCLLVANGKGLISKANPRREYIGGLFQGTLSLVDLSSGEAFEGLDLSQYCPPVVAARLRFMRASAP